MRKQTNHHSKLIPGLVIACALAIFGFSSAAQANGQPSIVGLWSVVFVSTVGGPTIPTYDQWHSDGNEFEAAGFFPGAVCQGTYKQKRDGTIHLYHVSWTFDSNGALNGRWDETQTDTVSADGMSYAGTYTKDFYDINNNFLFEDAGTLTATRLTVPH